MGGLRQRWGPSRVSGRRAEFRGQRTGEGCDESTGPRVCPQSPESKTPQKVRVSGTSPCCKETPDLSLHLESSRPLRAFPMDPPRPGGRDRYVRGLKREWNRFRADSNSEDAYTSSRRTRGLQAEVGRHFAYAFRSQLRPTGKEWRLRDVVDAYATDGKRWRPEQTRAAYAASSQRNSRTMFPFPATPAL